MKSFSSKDLVTSPRISPISKSKPGGFLSEIQSPPSSAYRELNRRFFHNSQWLNQPKGFQDWFNTSVDSFDSGFPRNNRQILSQDFRKIFLSPLSLLREQRRKSLADPSKILRQSPILSWLNFTKS